MRRKVLRLYKKQTQNIASLQKTDAKYCVSTEKCQKKIKAT